MLPESFQKVSRKFPYGSFGERKVNGEMLKNTGFARSLSVQESFCKVLEGSCEVLEGFRKILCSKFL